MTFDEWLSQMKSEALPFPAGIHPDSARKAWNAGILNEQTRVLLIIKDLWSGCDEMNHEAMGILQQAVKQIESGTHLVDTEYR